MHQMMLVRSRISYSADLVKSCGLRTSSNNSCHKLVSGQWVEPFVSFLHMPRRKHQGHGSLRGSIQMLPANMIENEKQHGTLKPFCTTSID